MERRLNRVAKGLGDFVVQIQRNIVNEVGKEVVQQTPVDTGYARGNWIPGLNSPPLVPVSTLDPNAVAAPARIGALAAILRVGDTFFIVNNAAYIELLNQGYSPQAAAQFISRAVTAGVKAGIAITSEFRVR